MGNSLFRLGHHVVIGSNDDDGDVGHLGTTGTHGCERLVARGVEECDLAAILQFHLVSTDVLGDATSLAGNHIGVADVVKK